MNVTNASSLSLTSFCTASLQFFPDWERSGCTISTASVSAAAVSRFAATAIYSCSFQTNEHYWFLNQGKWLSVQSLMVCTWIIVSWPDNQSVLWFVLWVFKAWDYRRVRYCDRQTAFKKTLRSIAASGGLETDWVDFRSVCPCVLFLPNIGNFLHPCRFLKCSETARTLRGGSSVLTPCCSACSHSHKRHLNLLTFFDTRILKKKKGYGPFPSTLSCSESPCGGWMGKSSQSVVGKSRTTGSFQLTRVSSTIAKHCGRVHR